MMSKNRHQPFTLLAILIITVVALFQQQGDAFQPMHSITTSAWRRISDDGTKRNVNHYVIRIDHISAMFASPRDESDSVQKLFDYESENFDNQIAEDDLEGIELGQPPEWMVMQQLLGINIFTVILAALIVFFLSMNMMLGPGWLGSKIGIPGTGSIQEVSPTLPGSINLNNPEYRL